MLRRHAERLREEQGFSLLELLVAMVVLTVVSTLITTGVMAAQRSVRDGEERRVALSELQSSLIRVARELRAADASPDVLTVAQPYQVETEVERVGARMRYRFTVDTATSRLLAVEENLDAGTAPATTVLAEDVDWSVEPAFVYLDATGAPAASMAEIRTVRVVLVREVPIRDVRVETLIRLRNAGGL